MKINSQFLKHSPFSILHSQLVQGFTLIELLLTMSLLFVIASSSTAFYSRFLSQNSVQSVQDQIIGDLRKAQINAMMGKQNSAWGVNIGSGVITLFSGTSFLARTSALDERFTYPASLQFSGPTEIVFTKITGIPNTSGTISITGVGTNKSVIINSQGIASR